VHAQRAVRVCHRTGSSHKLRRTGQIHGCLCGIVGSAEPNGESGGGLGNARSVNCDVDHDGACHHRVSTRGEVHQLQRANRGGAGQGVDSCHCLAIVVGETIAIEDLDEVGQIAK
jgi:hypothetical protein